MSKSVTFDVFMDSGLIFGLWMCGAILAEGEAMRFTEFVWRMTLSRLELTKDQAYSLEWLEVGYMVKGGEGILADIGPGAVLRGLLTGEMLGRLSDEELRVMVMEKLVFELPFGCLQMALVKEMMVRLGWDDDAFAEGKSG